MKYRADLNIKDIAKAIFQEVSDIDTLIKSKIKYYQQVISEHNSLCDAKGKSLLNRDLYSVVSPSDFVRSDFLDTLLVVVPK